MNNLHDSIIGSLLGGAIGDALGLPLEGIPPARAAKMFPNLQEYHFLGRKGFCSDDTEHSCMTALALLQSSASAPNFRIAAFSKNLAWRLRFWLLALPAGAGLATLRSIIKLWFGFPPDKSGVNSAGNGPAMRSAVIGVYAGGNHELMTSLVHASTIITHSDPRAFHGALAVALAASSAALGTPGKPVDFFMPLLQRTLGNDQENELLALISKASESANRNEDTTVFAESISAGKGVSGYMPHTVAVALHAWFRHPGDLRSALTTVVSCGGDTDTVAAITGGIVGAAVGKEGIPEEWLNNLWEWPCTIKWMETLGGCLADAGDEKAGCPPAINPLGVLLRNLLFLIIVLAHGFRRMLPPY